MFLSVVTRTFKRPKMFGANRKSLAMQTCRDFEEIVLRDEVGVGIAETHRRFWELELKSDYVWVFDDDNVLVDDEFFAKAKALAEQLSPDVIFVKGWVVGNILPDRWPVELGHIDTMNFIVSKVVWMRHRTDWALKYEADWLFIEAVMKDDPKTAWLDMIACKTIRGSRGAAEEWDFELPADVLSRDKTVPLRSVKDMMKIGDQIRAKQACAGMNFLCQVGELVTITKENFDICEGLLRGGNAEFVSASFQGEPMSNKRVLIFCPIGAKLDDATRDAIFGQKGVEVCDVMFTQDNPYKADGPEVLRNIQHNYEKMRRLVLDGGYDKVWICEADMVPPLDALSKLLEIDAPVVTGLYALRHGSEVPNLLHLAKGIHGWNWTDVRDKWGQTVEVGGGCMGCVVIDRSVLEKFSFILDKPIPPDIPLMQWCMENKIKQIARLDVVCGHIKPLGDVIWPDQERQTKIERAA